MKPNTSKIATLCTLGFGLLLWPSAGPADEARGGTPAFRSAQGQEVVAGSYHCYGTVYSDDNPAEINAGTYLSATSGITSDFYGTSRSSRDVPADLDAMDAICEAHIGRVVAQVPSICALGPVNHDRGEFGNGASTGSSFEFSCQGTRDEVIGVIGGFSRLSLSVGLP